jgi:hypothetical protein
MRAQGRGQARAKRAVSLAWPPITPPGALLFDAVEHPRGQIIALRDHEGRCVRRAGVEEDITIIFCENVHVPVFVAGCLSALGSLEELSVPIRVDSRP